MSKTFFERVGIEGGGHSSEFDLFKDTELAKEVSYVLRGYRVLERLHKAPHLEVGKGIHVFSTRFPQFKREGEIAFYGGKINESPHQPGEYWLMIDERLSETERLAVIAHELGHLAGGFHEEERPTQKAAIQVMTELYGGYDILADAKTVEDLHKGGIDFDIRERPREEFRKALEYLTRSRYAFGVTKEDLQDAGLQIEQRKRHRGLEDRFGFALIIIGLLLTASFSLSPTGLVIKETESKGIGFPIALVVLFLGVAIFVYTELRQPRLIR